MFSINLASYPRIIRYASKSYKIHDFNLQNHTQKACFCILSNRRQNKQIYTITNNVTDNSRTRVQLTNFLKYSTKPIEVPPLPPPPPPETEVFGILGGLKYETVELDQDELKEEERLKNIKENVPRKFKPSLGGYIKMIKNYIGKGDLKSAEEVIQQCKRNRDKPDSYMYNLVIRAFALQGDIKTCYKYFDEIRRRKYKIKANTYTSLLNACANSPDSEKALNYVERIREYMTKKDFRMVYTHYLVLVKVYGRHNKLEVANKLIQEMIDKKMNIGVTVINNLLYAANSNVESGLKHVLQYWQLMRRQKIPPDIFTYNLLLRAIRDTNFGDCTVKDLLLTEGDTSEVVTDSNRPNLLVYPPVMSALPLKNIKIKNYNALIEPPKSESLNSISTDEKDSTDAKDSIDVKDSTDVQVSTNVKSSREISSNSPALINSINLDSILKQNKLILFGGVDGFLQKMKDDRVEPNFKTLTFLIELVPGSVQAETAIINYAKSEKIPLDLDFYNMLIKKRSLRGAKKDARDVINDIHRADLKPNIVTYGVLALSCSSPKESRELLQAMKVTGHSLNKYVADSLLNPAIDNKDFGFILELMETMLDARVRLDEQTFEKLDKFQQNMTALIKRKHKSTNTERFKVGFSKFNMRYKSWQEQMGRKIITERKSKDA